MTSRTLALLILVPLSACGGGSGGDTGSSGPGSSGPGSSGSASSSGPTTDASGSEGSSTASVTTTGLTGGVTEASGTSTAGPSSSTSTGAASGTGDPDSSSGGASSTGGAGGSCVDVSGDYGPCEAIIGYGFDGTTCRAFSGCNCAPHCDDFWPDTISCALGCAAAGECNTAALHPAGINKDPVQEGSFCDELDACSSDPGSVEWLTEIFGMVECEPANYPCEQGQNCHLLWQGTLDEPKWSQVCAASLLPGADLQCVIWGP